MKHLDLEWLMARYLDGLADPEEIARLDEQVRQHPSAARELARTAMLDTAVCSLVKEAAAAAEFVVQGTVVTIQGAVVRADKDEELKVGDILAPGDRIATGPNGYLKYAYLDGSVVGLSPNSAITLLRKEGSVAKTVRLWTGLLDATIRRQPSDALMTFLTPHGSATVMGTILRVNATPKDDVVGVYSGQVEVSAKTEQVMVNAGEVAVAGEAELRKRADPDFLPAVSNIRYQDGPILFQDSFEQGLRHWVLYNKEGEGDRLRISEEAGCHDIRTVEVLRDGRLKRVAALTGNEPDGRRVGIFTKPIAWSYSEGAAFSLEYEYTYEGAPRPAMDGINIDVNWENNFPPFFNGTLTQKARPAGEWNRVKWVCVPGRDRRGRPVVDSRLFLNGEFLARRWEYGWWDGTGTHVGLVLEVPEGAFMFDNVVIRQMDPAAAR
jgi:hypothetical protein